MIERILKPSPLRNHPANFASRNCLARQIARNSCSDVRRHELFEPKTHLKSTMRPKLSFVFACVLLASFLGADTRVVFAEAPHDSTWQKEASQRLKAIYDNSEFKPVEFDPTWKSDSSSFTVRQADPETKKPAMWRYDAATGKRTKVDTDDSKKPGRGKQAGRGRRGGRGGVVSPNGKKVLETRDRKLFVRDLDSDQSTQLTPDVADREISYGNLSWSPNGEYVLFAESDRTELERRPVLVPGDPTFPKVEMTPYARVGGKIVAQRVGVVKANGEGFQWLPLEMPEDGFYLGQVEWAGNSTEILVETMTRFRDEHDFWLATVGGEMKRIYHDTNEAWAVGSHGLVTGLNWVQGGDAFVALSEQDGWRHAYLCLRNGKQETKLTVGDYDIIDRAVIDEDGGWFYFYASPDNATQKYLYRVPMDGSGTLERITPKDQPGTHEYIFSPDAKYAVHTYSTLNSPPVVDLVEVAGHRVVSVLEDNAELRERSKQIIANPTEFVQLDIGGGVVMDASVTKPKDFDPTKKYPVFVYVYGEPYLQTVLDRWGAAQIDFLRVVADAGYITVSIDNRGTACPKGAAWRRSVFGSLGPLSTEEQAAALKELGRMHSYVDLSRVAIWGWSGGGSNTLNALFRKPDVYHVGIAVVPKPQPWLYNAWFQEIYMRTREVNAEGYERSAPINFAEGLKGKLLIVTGSGETNTHIQIIEGLVDRLIELGKPFDYMVYPNRDHGLREGTGTVVHVRMLILRYLIENLPRGPQPVAAKA